MAYVPRVKVVTFATLSGEKPFKDYSDRIKVLADQVGSFGFTFRAYSFTDINKLIKNSEFETYPYFQRGVGGWFWNQNAAGRDKPRRIQNGCQNM
jgi:hypothetical protein